MINWRDRLDILFESSLDCVPAINEDDDEDELLSAGDLRYTTNRALEKFNNITKKIFEYKKIAIKYGLLREFEEILNQVFAHRSPDEPLSPQHPMTYGEAQQLLTDLTKGFTNLRIQRRDAFDSIMAVLNPYGAEIGSRVNSKNHKIVILDPNLTVLENYHSLLTYLRSYTGTNEDAAKVIRMIEPLYNNNLKALSKLNDERELDMSEGQIKYLAGIYALWNAATQIKSSIAVK